MLGKAVDRKLRRIDQAPDLFRASQILVFRRLAALLDLDQAMAQRIDQRRSPLAIVEQVVFQIGVALYDPDIAQHLVKHARRAAGDALGAKFVEDCPIVGAEQADDDFAIGKRSVVVGDFAQAGGHRGGQVALENEF